MTSSPIRLACAALFVVACGDDGDTVTTPATMTVAGSTSTPGGEDSSGAPTSSGAGTTADESSSGADPTTGEPPWEPIPARGGIEVDWVEANQGVGVAIGRDGTGVAGADRTSYLIQNRLTLIRAFWKTLPPDWEPRKIEGRLIVTYPDNPEPLVLSNKPTVEGEAFTGNLSKSFYWGLMPDQVVPGLRYRIELWETGPGQEDLPEPATPPQLPVDGSSTYIGIEDSDQVLKITLVPFNYNSGDGCVTQPDTSEKTMQLFYDQMYMMNPVDTLELTIHDPVDWNEKLSDFNELNAYMSGMRADENAEPERYYYGLVDVCAGGLGDAGGKAYGIPQGGKLEDAWQRVSSGLSLDAEWSSETFVHEVGHSQGRYHVYCNGEEGGPDFGYPYDHGELGEWGFGVINYNLYHPTVHRDYMTYCHPVWASPWGWNKVYPIIRTLSSWDDNGKPAPDPGTEIGSLLVGSIYPNGREDWITVPGGIRPEQRSAVHGVEFVIDGKPHHVAGAWLPQPDGDIVNLAVPLPARWDDVTQITRVAGPARVAVDRKKIDQHHRPRPIAAP